MKRATTTDVQVLVIEWPLEILQLIWRCFYTNNGNENDFQDFQKVSLLSKYFSSWLSEEMRSIQILPFYLQSELKDSTVEKYIGLKSLILGENEKLRDKGLTKLQSLTELNLDGNKKITNKGLRKMTGLHILDLGYDNEVSSKAIRKFSCLTKLRITTRIASQDLFDYMPLTYLDVSWNRSFVPRMLQYLTRLETLKMNGRVPIDNDALRRMTNLRRLSVEENPFIIGTALQKLPLHSLSLGENQSIRGTDLLSLAPTLKTLNLSRNFVIKDQDLLPLEKLSKIMLTSNYVVTNTGLNQLTGITSLDITNNPNINVSELKYKSSLRWLNIYGNKLNNYFKLSKELPNCKICQ